MADYRPVYSYNVAISTSVTTGSRVTPFPTQRIRLATTAPCYICIGSAAQCALLTTANGMLIQPSIAGEMFTVGTGDQVATIAASSGGTLNVTELTQ